MPVQADLDAVYAPSPDVVARTIEGELIIVPISAGVGDLEGELYTLNETGHAIWDRLDGRTLRQIVLALAEEFDAPAEVLERDAVGLVGELLRRSIVVRKEA